MERAGGKGNQAFAHHCYDLRYRDTAIPVVRLFRYLGLDFDGSGSTKSMMEGRLREARKSWGKLIGSLVARGWQDRATRLALFDAYVRSVLLYGCSVWGNYYIKPASGELTVGPG